MNKNPYIKAVQIAINKATITKPYTKPFPIENKSKNIFLKISTTLDIAPLLYETDNIFYHKNP
jgi:hypothetical protein